LLFVFYALSKNCFILSAALPVDRADERREGRDDPPPDLDFSWLTVLNCNTGGSVGVATCGGVGLAVSMPMGCVAWRDSCGAAAVGWVAMRGSIVAAKAGSDGADAV